MHVNKKPLNSTAVNDSCSSYGLLELRTKKMEFKRDSFLSKNPLSYLWPLLVFTVVISVIMKFNLDLLLATKLYAWQGNEWRFQDSWLLQEFIHRGGRALILLFYVALLATLLASFILPKLKTYRKGFAYVLSSVALSLIAVSLLKEFSNIDCPWGLRQFGGDDAYQPFYLAVFGSGSGRCFPAGHASAAYAWFALYFFCKEYFSIWRKKILGMVMVLGVIFGISQQIRGAHFLSHDLWTLTICWYMSLLMFTLFRFQRPKKRLVEIHLLAQPV